MLFAMHTPLWAFALCCFGCMVLCCQGQKLCTDMVEFTEDADSRTAAFQYQVEQPETNTYVEIIVYVANICQNNLCAFTLDTNPKNMKLLYRNGMPLSYKLNFRGESRLAGIKGIALKNSTDCVVLCENPQDKVEPGAKTMKYGFYPYGRSNSVKANCDPLLSFLPISISNKVIGPDLTPTDDRCGVISPKLNFIELAIGGEAIRRGSWPWLVALNRLKDNDQTFICGGTLISRKIVLTANHCLYDPDTRDPLRHDELLLFMGRHDRADYNEQHFTQYNVHHVVRHPDYRPMSLKFDADIAFLVTDREVQYTDFIRPACLWEDNEDIDSLVGEQGSVVGWGVDETGGTSSKPKRVNGALVSDKKCIESNPSFDSITTKRNFCAGDRDGTGPCSGDSGGAFMLHKNDKWTIRGIVSASLQKTVDSRTVCDTGNYAVFTDVVKFRHWLNEEIDKYIE